MFVKLFGLWLCLSIGSHAASVNPSVSTKETAKFVPADLTLGASYRQARDFYGTNAGGNDYNYRSYDRPQTRCISCLYAAMTEQSQDRYSYIAIF